MPEPRAPGERLLVSEWYIHDAAGYEDYIYRAELAPRCLRKMLPGPSVASRGDLGAVGENFMKSSLVESHTLHNLSKRVASVAAA